MEECHLYEISLALYFIFVPPYILFAKILNCVPRNQELWIDFVLSNLFIWGNKILPTNFKILFTTITMYNTFREINN